MNKETFEDKALRMASLLRNSAEEGVRQYVNDIYNEGYDAGLAFQKKLDVRSAVMAFLELKVKDQDIYRLLSEHFGIDSIAEATELLKNVKISRQIIAPRKHCEKIGISDDDFYWYSRSHNLEERLAEDEKLLNMQPDKLKAIIDGN